VRDVSERGGMYQRGRRYRTSEYNTEISNTSSRHPDT